MDKPEDEKYWTASATKGFDFDSEDNVQDHSADIFGATAFQTAQLSKELKQHIPQQPASYSPGGTHVKLSQSLSSLSTSSNSSLKIKSAEPSKQCEITCKLLSSTFNDVAVLSPKDVIRSIFLGMSYDLSCFRKLSDKKILLDEALKLGDGDVVCSVLLFLQKSLHQKILFQLLKDRPSAAQEYIAILEKQKAYKEAAWLCSELQQPKEAVIHLYNSCLLEEEKNLLPALEHTKNKLKQLKNVEIEADVLREHVQLLERQYPIALTKTRAQDLPNETFKITPLIGKPVGSSDLIGSSLLSTLQYCCRFSWDAPENLLASPMGIKKIFNLTERQFVWNAFIGRLLSGNDPLPILLTKGMFGAAKVTGGLSIPKILEIASALNGQQNLYDQLLTLTEPTDKRYELAKRYGRHRIAIDVLISNKDRVGLLRYKDSISDQVNIDYINNTLRVSSTRWKN